MSKKNTKKVYYTGSHMQARADAVKKIWIEDYKREKRGSFSTYIPGLISYSFGFLAGAKLHTREAWLSSIIVSFCLFIFIRYVMKSWAIPAHKYGEKNT